MKKPGYKDLFLRNRGIFSSDQQEKIQRTKILLVGCGGIGGTMAVVLARTGVEHFILVDFDSYDASNMNRQVACFTGTLGEKKVEALARQIKQINPRARVETHAELLPLEKIAQLARKVDVVAPAADDYAFSIMVFRAARAANKPAVLAVPSGTWANVSLILPDGPCLEDLQGIPALSSYQEFKDLFETKKYKLGTAFYVPVANWRKDYYRKFIEEDAPPTQLCHTVWIASCLAAQEIIKCVSGSEKPVAAPRFWSIKGNRISVHRIHGLSVETALYWQRKIGWRLFRSRFGGIVESAQNLWWKVVR